MGLLPLKTCTKIALSNSSAQPLTRKRKTHKKHCTPTAEVYTPHPSTYAGLDKN
jgi:hypothetical protein